MASIIRQVTGIDLLLACLARRLTASFDSSIITGSGVFKTSSLPSDLRTSLRVLYQLMKFSPFSLSSSRKGRMLKIELLLLLLLVIVSKDRKNKIAKFNFIFIKEPKNMQMFLGCHSIQLISQFE